MFVTLFGFRVSRFSHLLPGHFSAVKYLNCGNRAFKYCILFYPLHESILNLLNVEMYIFEEDTNTKKRVSFDVCVLLTARSGSAQSAGGQSASPGIQTGRQCGSGRGEE